MGQILSHPYTIKQKEENNGSSSSFGICSMQGWRTTMEDEHITLPSLLDCLLKDEVHTETVKLIMSQMSEDNKEFLKQLAFYAVFDGHGGDFVAQFSGANVARILATIIDQEKANLDEKKASLSDCLTKAFLTADEELLEDKYTQLDHSGCTATSLLIDSKDKVMYCANSGDSRTVLAINGVAKNLSFDHKPVNSGEKTRIVQSGGFVESGRVNGNLALSRAIGDFEFKNSNLPPEEQTVTVVPDIICHDIDLEFDDFVILACDGIWDCLSSQECVNLIYYAIQQFPADKEFSLAEISSIIVDVCCSPDAGGHGIGCDNMTMMVVALLKENETLAEWKARIIAKEIKIADDATFIEYRKKIFNYYQFIDGEEFAVTRKSGKITFDSTSEETNEDEDMEGDDMGSTGNKGKGGLHRQMGQLSSQGTASPGRNPNEKVIKVPLSQILQLGGQDLTSDQNGMSYIKGDLFKALGLTSGILGNEEIEELEQEDVNMEEEPNTNDDNAEKK
ncbi:related to Protein phosphatase 2C homolog 3 [Hanseniaspora guilliermondii]|uniref:protein-serine/threonine phosphatase n=1 Tax=Hanseniaspora guilliermondii TaxID=56406 RepID=A0A1L0CKQ3_9ASCO|nr:related to Protein phosphatase 2C homolog 3 [Hanseniaspora guilliermondii]